MATELCPNEGKHWILTHAISGGTFYGFLLHGVTVAGYGITATTALSTLQSASEVSGSSYSRATVVFGTADSNGIIPMPAVAFHTGGGTNWNTDVQAWGLSTHQSAGTALYYWDLSTTRNMHSAGATLSIGTLDFFLLNPGE